VVPDAAADRGRGAREYRCYTCNAEVRFFKCPNCSLVQTVSKQWRMFTCGKCDTKQDLPFRWGYDRASTAMRVEGMGKSWAPAVIQLRRR
jgi:primosomal protein N'